MCHLQRESYNLSNTHLRACVRLGLNTRLYIRNSVPWLVGSKRNESLILGLGFDEGRALGTRITLIRAQSHGEGIER